MSEIDPAPTNQGSTNPLPVIFFHGVGTSAPQEDWVQSLLNRDLELYGRTALEGVSATEVSLDQLGALCLEISRRAPDRGLLILRQGIGLSENGLEELQHLMAKAPGLGAYTTFSNADAEVNPFAGLSGSAGDGAFREHLVALLGRGELHPLHHWPKHLLALTADTVNVLADERLSWADGAGRLRQRRVQVELADWIWTEDPDAPWSRDQALEPHENPRPSPWGILAERLQQWLQQLDKKQPLPGLPQPGSSPTTLHITHSWGGGVAAWVESFIDADPSGLHLQLRSEGPQSHQGAGQCLTLYLGNQLTTPLDRWWLQPPIEAVETANLQYREIIDHVCDRFGVGRILVSSLVGHSLDALRTTLPTTQVLHDHFPAWPLLSIHPVEFDGDLKRAMKDRRAREQFPGMSLEDWRRITEQYIEAAENLPRIAPSQSALEVQASIDPSLSKEQSSIIPHGLPALERSPVPPKPRKDGKLRLVIPGRVQSGKGAELLAAALPELTHMAQVTLLGTGKGGERFFGIGGVNVVLQYDRSELPEILRTLGPHCAALLSLVPETFSYTLSEMKAMAIPVIATRRGSFLERIEHGANGWLVEPTPEAFLEQLKSLADTPDRLEAARKRLKTEPHPNTRDMFEQYEALCPVDPRAPLRPMPAVLDLYSVQANARAHETLRASHELQAAERQGRELSRELKARTAWAEKTQLELAKVRKERDQSQQRNEVQEQELSKRSHHIEDLDQRIGQLDQRMLSLQARIEDTERQRDHANSEKVRLDSEISNLLNSRSWKLTRPLRVTRRLAANLRVARAWNPLRWPLLASRFFRNVATVGWSASLTRLQHFEHQSAPRSTLTTSPGESTTATPEDTSLPQALPLSHTPRVSIIIPAYNHLHHTAGCLRSIATTPSSVPFEVIVVDDASRDETQDALTELEGLRYLRNEENLGFIRSCNRGASQARGDFVLFLNNDTEVEPGWLDALTETFETRADAGLIGARLVYPDGRLQECGGLVFNDGSGWNLGRGDDPDRPEYQNLREVDYCSGACIMLRRELLEALGGFDEHYIPAYYEDTDLAFRVREQGLKVYVQPTATVIHFEGVTSGTDLSTGTKRFQAVNRKKFLKRWEGTLREHPAPISNPQDAKAVRHARDHRRSGRVLVIDAYTPEPDQDSGSVRLVNLMTCLDELGYAVTFFADNRGWAGDYTRALQRQGVEAWYDPWLPSVERFFEERGTDFDLIIISRHYVAQNYLDLLKKFAPQATFLFDTVDLHYLREERLAALEDSKTLRQVARQTRRSELAVMRAADATLVVSPVEQALLREERPEEPVFILSNIHEISPTDSGFSQRSDLLFVGGYQHPPNIDAAQWFVNDIWPLVRQRLPEVKFHLIGSKAPESVRALHGNGVEFHGFVEDLNPFLERCRISVAPLRYGAGVKGKVNQAMAHGQPVVATPAAVEGINARDGEDVLVADTAEDFADAVVRLYEDEDLWRRLSGNGMENVQQHFSRDAAKQNILALLKSLES